MGINILRMKDGKWPVSYHHIVQGNKETLAQMQHTGKRKYWHHQQRTFPLKQENSTDQLDRLLLRIHLEKVQSHYLWAWHKHKFCEWVELKTHEHLQKMRMITFYLRDILVYKVLNGMHVELCLTWSATFQKSIVFAQAWVTLCAIAGHI